MERIKYGTQILNLICKFWYFNIWMLYLKWLRKGKLNSDDEIYASLMLKWDNDLFHICTYCLHDFLGLLMLEFSVQEFDHGFNGELRHKLLQTWHSQGWISRKYSNLIVMCFISYMWILCVFSNLVHVLLESSHF